MKTLCFLPSLMLITVCLSGQTSQTVILENNIVSSESIKPELQYIFPDFQKGYVFFKDQHVVPCRLNYNFLLDEIMYLDADGKKMALANPQDLSYIIIANRKFIPSSKGYYEVIESGDISLVYKWTCNIVEKGKKGALGIANDAPSVYQMNQISFDSRTWKLDVDKEAVADVKVIPFLKTGARYIIVKGEKEFLKTYSGKRSEIKAYLNKEPVDFKREADLRRLTKYCNSL
jgi:hypothetical protein